jgi:hypothetical protein
MTTIADPPSTPWRLSNLSEPVAESGLSGGDGTLAQKLTDLADRALEVQKEILEMPLDAQPNKAILNAKSQTANNVARLQASIEEAKFRQKQRDILPMLLERLAEARRELGHDDPA